jgi:endonuclease YncB( thermonuclease family)
MKTLTCLAVIGLIALSAPAIAQSPLWGIGRAGDGDSLTVGETRVRLFGIDAPEFAQSCKRNGQEWACGAAAAEELGKLVTGKQVRCVSLGTDQHGRMLGRCSVGTLDISRAMVASGHAVAFRRYSIDYVSAEDSAKANRRGLWSGTFTMPSKHRSATAPAVAPSIPNLKRRPSQPSSSNWPGRAAANCNIKGNRSRRGQWIYHVPGMPYYDQTRPEEIFCTEADARAAGYRRAIVR